MFGCAIQGFQCHSPFSFKGSWESKWQCQSLGQKIIELHKVLLCMQYYQCVCEQVNGENTIHEASEYKQMGVPTTAIPWGGPKEQA